MSYLQAFYATSLGQGHKLVRISDTEKGGGHVLDVLRQRRSNEDLIKAIDD